MSVPQSPAQPSPLQNLRSLTLWAPPTPSMACWASPNPARMARGAMMTVRTESNLCYDPHQNKCRELRCINSQSSSTPRSEVEDNWTQVKCRCPLLTSTLPACWIFFQLFSMKRCCHGVYLTPWKEKDQANGDAQFVHKKCKTGLLFCTSQTKTGVSTSWLINHWPMQEERSFKGGLQNTNNATHKMTKSVQTIHI